MSKDGTMSKEDIYTATRHLRRILSSERAVFAIGGIISSAEPSSLSAPKGFLPSPTSASYPVVTISWKNLDDYRTCNTVSLPLLGDDGQEEFKGLVRDHHQGHVSEFIVNFSPYDYGIADAVGRLLCPSHRYGFLKQQEVKAQLSSLDVGLTESNQMIWRSC